MACETFGESKLSSEQESRVQSELESGEQLLWTGRPRAGRLILESIPLVLFGIPWTAFTIFFISMVTFSVMQDGNKKEPVLGLYSFLLLLFGVPFVLVGLWMLSSPLWMYRQIKQICYAITNRRVILWDPNSFWGAMYIRSYVPRQLASLLRTERADGSGDLIFEEQYYQTRGQHKPRAQRIGFMAIDNVRTVDELVRKALLGSEQK